MIHEGRIRIVDRWRWENRAFGVGIGVCVFEEIVLIPRSCIYTQQTMPQQQ